MLVEVVLDLMVNAVKAVPEGHVERDEIAVTTGVDPTGRVFIEVRDTGQGTAPETKRCIVGPRFTTEAGCGFALVQSAVTSCGGDMSVSSVRGEGSTVRVCLPAAQVRRRQGRASWLRPDGGTASWSWTTRRRWYGSSGGY